MTNHAVWTRIWNYLSNEKPGTRIAFEKYELPHPRDAGARHSVGLPVEYNGEHAIADYRFPPNAACAGLHVREYRNHWVAHVDQVHPECGPVEHLRKDAPGTFVAGGAGVGAALGAALGRSWGSALAGAGIGLLIAAVLLDDK